MEPQLLDSIHATEKTVTHLVNECRKNGPVYAQAPKAAAQVSRTGKWLLNAIAALQKALGTSSAGEDVPAS